MRRPIPFRRTPHRTLVRPALAWSALAAATAATLAPGPASAAGSGWSVVPYVGASLLGDPSPSIAGADDIVDGNLDIAVDSGFVAGLDLRHGYPGSRWTAGLGWEYRTNDSTTTAADGRVLPDGNYASNTFHLDGRYALGAGNRWTPWIGGGLVWAQEVDLDSEDDDGERSFADSGAFGFQLMAGVDVDLGERFYLSGELRYTGVSGLDLDKEGGAGTVSDIDYRPITLGVGLGVRF